MANACRVVLGTSFGDLVEERHRPTTLSAFIATMREHNGRSSPASTPWLARAASMLSSHAAGYIDSIIAVIAQSPPYLADIAVADICPALLEEPAIKAALALQATVADPAWLFAAAAEFGARPVAVDPSDASLKLFAGPPFSISYPLHRDHADGDVFTFMLSGCMSARP